MPIIIDPVPPIEESNPIIGDNNIERNNFYTKIEALGLDVILHPISGVINIDNEVYSAKSNRIDSFKTDGKYKPVDRNATFEHFVQVHY